MSGIRRNYVFIAIGIILFSWTLWAELLATQEALKASDTYHIDKLMHFLGGVLVVGVPLYYFRFSKFVAFAFLIFIGIGWEVFEVLFFPNVRHFYETMHAQWISDARGDIILDILGGLFYLLYEKRFFVSANNNENLSSE